MRHRLSTVVVTALALALLPTRALDAQQTRAGRGVAGSGLEQGEVLVAVRSDVRLSVKGIRATLTDRLAGITEAVSSQMPRIRECYSSLIATRPATVGGLRAVIVLEAGAAPVSMDISEVNGSDATLAACVGKILRAIDLRGVARPAAVEVELAFDNTRARGQAQVDARQAEFAANVERAPDGSYVGSWQTDGAELAFEVRVAADGGEPSAAALVVAIRSGFYGFVDCRRRAGRQGMNAAGELELELTIAADGKVTGRVTRSTVEDRKRTPTCVEKAATRLQIAGPRGVRRATVVVRFAG